MSRAPQNPPLQADTTIRRFLPRSAVSTYTASSNHSAACIAQLANFSTALRTKL